MTEDHSWMYNGWDKGGNYTDEWMDKATIFLDHAFSQTQIMRCPCSRCQNSKCLEDKRTIVIHLCKNGFVLDYEVCTFHGKSGTRVIAEDEHDYDMGDIDRMEYGGISIAIGLLDYPHFQWRNYRCIHGWGLFVIGSP
jgi:hypothetical protein